MMDRNKLDKMLAAMNNNNVPIRFKEMFQELAADFKNVQDEYLTTCDALELRNREIVILRKRLAVYETVPGGQ